MVVGADASLRRRNEPNSHPKSMWDVGHAVLSRPDGGRHREASDPGRKMQAGCGSAANRYYCMQMIPTINKLSLLKSLLVL